MILPKYELYCTATSSLDKLLKHLVDRSTHMNLASLTCM